MEPTVPHLFLRSDRCLPFFELTKRVWQHRLDSQLGKQTSTLWLQYHVVRLTHRLDLQLLLIHSLGPKHSEKHRTGHVMLSEEEFVVPVTLFVKFELLYS